MLPMASTSVANMKATNSKVKTNDRLPRDIMERGETVVQSYALCAIDIITQTYIEQPAFRLPKEATCDVECAMKVESLRILTKKRKQSQRADNAAVNTTGGTLNGVKRALSEGSEGERPASGYGMDYGTVPGGLSSLGKGSSGGASPGGSAGNNGKDSQRRRFVWSEQLHQDFVAAVFDIGLKCASPKLLLEMMPLVDGLTSEHIKSHLQKYRLHRQRSRQEFLKSYGYLTDLDGGKGLGGGSAAAAIKAAASAAGDGKKPASRLGGQTPDDSVCGGRSCGCNDSENGDRDPVANGVTRCRSEDAGDPTRLPEVTSEEINKCLLASGIGGEGVSDDKEDAGMETQSRGTGVMEEAAQLRPPRKTTTASLPVVSSGLLQSHLELLAKGIDLQIKFHRHLREVVNSQQALQTQLLGPHGKNCHLRQRNVDQNDPPAAAEVMGTTEGRNPRTSVAELLQMAVPEIRGPKLHNTPREWFDMKSGAWLEESLMSPVAMKSATSRNEKAASPCRDKSATMQDQRPAPKEPVTSKRNQEGSPGINICGLETETFATSSSPAPAFSASAVAASTNGGLSRQNSVEMDQQQVRHGEIGSSAQLNAVPLRTAVATRPGVGKLTTRSVPLDHSAGNGVHRRSYVPGDFTLSGTEEISGGASSRIEATGLLLSGGRGAIAAHSTANTRVDLPVLGRAQSAPAGVPGQDPRTLQRHMQAQMEIQRTMLEACAGRASLSAVHSPWSGHGVAPTPVTPLASPNVIATSASAQKSRSDGAEVSGKESNGVAPVSRDQASDAQSVQPPDVGDTMFSGLLSTDDAFSFDLPDRGDLQQGESSVAHRPADEVHQSFLSFLM